MIKAEKWHYTAPYLLNPQHPITVNVIGAGGNGSQVLTQLARIDQSLKRLGHTGLFVTCYDDDVVSESNMGRQLFSPADIGLNKAVVLITRLNQCFGTAWKAKPVLYKKGSKEREYANVFITCVDNKESRKVVSEVLGYTTQKNFNKYLEPFEKPYYWIDLGNTQNTGQFVIGSCGAIEQPKQTETLLPVRALQNIYERFPEALKQRSKVSGPSCSLSDALKKQDLFINSMLVQLAMHTFWKMFREGKIDHHGAFINLKTLDIAKINL